MNCEHGVDEDGFCMKCVRDGENKPSKDDRDTGRNICGGCGEVIDGPGHGDCGDAQWG